MSLIIQDGRGQGYTGGVTPENELLTHATSQGHLGVTSRQNGSAFYAISGFIPLTTTASFSGILYLKNTGEVPVYIWNVRTSGTVAQQWQFIKNPTAGTLISGGTAITPQNLNFQSTNAFVGTVLYGADAQTVTDGANLTQWASGVGRGAQDFDGSVIIGPGGSIALTCKPGAAGDVGASVLVTQEEITV